MRADQRTRLWEYETKVRQDAQDGLKALSSHPKRLNEHISEERQKAKERKGDE